VVDVHVETAGGEGPEASLSVLSRAEAERLRQAVFGHARQAASVAAAAVAASADVAVERQIVRQLSLRELVWAGLTSNRMASALVLAGAVWALVDDVLPENVYEKFAKAAVEEAQLVLQQGTQTAVLLAVLGLAVLFLISVVVSVIGSVVLFYGFTLSRRDEDLHRSYGLLTRRSSSLPRRRLQILEIEEGFLRRLFRLATLRADTAGSAKESEAAGAGRDVLLPIVRREEVEHLLPLFFPDLQPVPTEWRRVSRRAIVRGTLKGSLICVLAAVAAVAWQGDPTGLWPLLLVPLVYGVNVMRYYNLAYAVDASYFRSRRGWLSRSTHIVPIRNAQSVVVRQTPFDRRLGLATLVVDTAGQAFTGGGPRISNLPLEEARQLAHSLAHRAAATRYRW
jgi:putative membrane protein